MELKSKKILVTGGNGFLGSCVVGVLVARGVDRTDIFTPTSKDIDLTKWENCESVVKGIDIVIHLAAVVGGIGANQRYPGRFFYDNMIMGVQLIEASRLAAVKKFVAIGTICSYPENPIVPFKEEELWNGYPTATTAPYGLAKKMLLVQEQAYREEYGFNSIYLLPTNLYGPGDNFDLESSHVIAALIRKAVTAVETNSDFLDVWGTGTATRDFLYINDAAEAIVAATEQTDKTIPINIGSGVEVSIKELAETICELVGFKGQIKWDATKPDGQPRRCLDISRAREEFGFNPQTNIREGLKETIAWYKKNKLV